MSSAQTLSVLVPSSDQTKLLEACLSTGERARSAWRHWCASRGNAASLQHDLAAARTLLALLSRSVVSNQLEAPPQVFAYVRAAALREELRAERFRQIAARVLAALAAAGAHAHVVRGAALAAAVYPQWSLRHCHDLDVLVPAEELRDAAAALATCECRPVRHAAERGAVLRHSSGLEIALHTQPFHVPYYDAPLAFFVENGRSVVIEGAQARMPSVEASLVHVLGHASCTSSWRNLRWVADAWHLVAAGPDWDEVTRRVEAHRLALPVSILLAYIARLDARVPCEIVHFLQRSTSTATGVAEDVAIGGALAARAGDLAVLWQRTHSWPARARLARWMFAPSVGYLRSAYRFNAAVLSPLFYVYRPFRFAGGRLEARVARSPTAARTLDHAPAAR